MRTKKLWLVSVLVLYLALVPILVACSGSNSKHTHTWKQWETTTQAACTTDGERIRACTDCSHTETAIISAIGHNYLQQNGLTATCIAAGYTAYSKCLRCEDITGKTPTAVNPDNHNYTESWFGNTATCTDGGIEYKGCQRSGCIYIESRPTVARGHLFSQPQKKLDATCLTDGYSAHYKCTRNGCDETYEKIIIPAGPDYHNYVEGICVYCLQAK